MINLMAAQETTEAGVQEAREVDQPSSVTEQVGAVEFLLVRGVPGVQIASGLGVSFEVIRAVERTVEGDNAIQRYQDACLECARADNHIREAAEYLYVRGYTPKKLKTLGFVKADTDLDPVKRARYWRKLIAQAQARLQGNPTELPQAQGAEPH